MILLTFILQGSSSGSHQSDSESNDAITLRPGGKSQVYFLDAIEPTAVT